MIQSVIHTSDIHIRLFKRHEEYMEQFEKFFKECEKEQPDRITVVGDLVHSKNQMTPELIHMVTTFLTRCSKIAKTVVTLGNHDFLANNQDRLDALTPLISTMDNSNILFLKHTGCYVDENVVWCVYAFSGGAAAHEPGAGLPGVVQLARRPGAGALPGRAGWHHAVLSQLLRRHSQRADQRGAHRRRGLLAHLLAHRAAHVHAHFDGDADLAVHQHLERLSVRRGLQQR